MEKEHGRGRWLGVYGGDTFIGDNNISLESFDLQDTICKQNLLSNLFMKLQLENLILVKQTTNYILSEKSPDLGAAMHFLKSR